MFFITLLLLLGPLAVDVRQRDLLGFDKAQAEVHVNLGDCLIEPAALEQADKFDRVAALMAAVAVPAGLVHLEGGCLLAVEGAADVSAPVGCEAVVTNDLE